LFFCLFFFLFVYSYMNELPTSNTIPPDPPKLEWPHKFSTWVIIEIQNVSIEGNNKTIEIKGQNIVFDMENQISCRYNQQFDLKREQKATDFCDYNKGMHYQIKDDADPDTPCTLNKKLELSSMVPISWPKEFFEGHNFKYMGLDHVAKDWCNHFVNVGFELGEQKIQLDIWVTNDTNQYPCRMSGFEVGSPIQIAWAFDGFSTKIPMAAKRCSAARVVCNESGYICKPVDPPLNDTDAYGIATRFCCSNPSQFDCSPINPGGEFYLPNNLSSHCDWLFQSYFNTFKMDFGEDACLPDVAQLVKKQEEKQDIKKEEVVQSISFFDFFKDSLNPIRAIQKDLVCNA